MEHLSDSAALPDRPWPSEWRWRLLRACLLGTGASLVLIASAFLLAGAWGAGAGRSAAAGQTEPSVTRAGRWAAGPDRLSVAAGLAGIDPEKLAWGVLQLRASFSPTPRATAPAPARAPARPAAAAALIESVPAPQSLPDVAPVPPPPPLVVPALPAPPARGCPTAGMSGFGLALFDAINRERAQLGMAALAGDGCVVYVAQLRSDDMAAAGYFSHTSPSGDTAFSLLDLYGVPYGWAGENLARNNYPDDESVAVAVRDLMASPSHRANILGPNYTHLGVAVADDGAGMRYYTMVFIGPA
jgi:uncharacterized protein YkwD